MLGDAEASPKEGGRRWSDVGIRDSRVRARECLAIDIPPITGARTRVKGNRAWAALLLAGLLPACAANGDAVNGDGLPTARTAATAATAPTASTATTATTAPILETAPTVATARTAPTAPTASTSGGR